MHENVLTLYLPLELMDREILLVGLPDNPLNYPALLLYCLVLGYAQILSKKAQEYHDGLKNTLTVISFWFFKIELR